MRGNYTGIHALYSSVVLAILNNENPREPADIMRVRTLVATIMLILTPLTYAQETPADGLMQRLSETRLRLNLSDNQVEQLKPVVESSVSTQRVILEKYGIDISGSAENSGSRVGLRDARKLGNELESVRADTLSKLEPILSDEQLAEYKVIQAERRDAIRQRIRDRR